MALRINTNVASLNAQRSLTNSTAALNKSLEKLSSGMRINRAADDVAGLAISEALKSDIRALGQAGRNAADGVSMVQLAEGALDEVSGVLVRLRELAEQAANETMGSTERGYIDTRPGGRTGNGTFNDLGDLPFEPRSICQRGKANPGIR